MKKWFRVGKTSSYEGDKFTAIETNPGDGWDAIAHTLNDKGRRNAKFIVQACNDFANRNAFVDKVEMTPEMKVNERRISAAFKKP